MTMFKMTTTTMMKTMMMTFLHLKTIVKIEMMKMVEMEEMEEMAQTLQF